MIMRNKTDSQSTQLGSKQTWVWFYSKNNFEMKIIANEDMKHSTKISDNFSNCIYYGFQEPFKSGKNDGSKDFLEKL